MEEGVWVTGPDGELIPDYDSSFPEINEGEVVHGTVVRVDKDEVLVDIGYKSEGVIPVAELTIRRSVNPADEVSVGDEIDALVLTKEDTEGRLILSKKRARFELAWKKIEAAAESGEPVIGKVIEVVKGGLILDLGVRGFLPASLVDIRRVQDLDEFLARELRCKVIELNRSRNNVVLSRRAVLEDERKEMRQAILDRLNPGDTIEGQISNIVDFGAFVDLDGMDGLIHISELSWSHVNHPSEVLEIGQTVNVKVLDIDRDRQRISLGLKQTQSDPWQQVLDSYGESDVVEGRVAKVVTFGAFVEILPGVEGLVHISELARHHVENPREVVSQGDAVNVKILEIDGERRRLSLSLKQVEEGEQPVPRADGAESVHDMPDLKLSEEAFPTERRRGRGDASRSPSIRGAGRRGRGGALLPRSRPSPSRTSRSRPLSRPSPRTKSLPPRSRRSRLPPRSRQSPSADEPEPAAAEPEPEAEAPAAEVEAEPPAAEVEAEPVSDEPEPAAEAEPADESRRTSPPRTPLRPIAVAITGGIGAGKSTALASFRRHGAATVSSDEIVHHLLANDPEVKRALVERLGEDILGEDGAPDRERIAFRVFTRPRRARLPRAAPAPARLARVPRLARAVGRAPEPAARLRDRGPAPVRGRRRRALRQGGRDHGARRSCARRRRGGRRDDREARLLPDKEKAKRADFTYVNTGTPDELDAWVAGVMATLTAEAPAPASRRSANPSSSPRSRSLAVCRGGRVGGRDRAGRLPARALPARVRGHRPHARAQPRPRPGARGRGRVRREPIRPERGVGGRRGRPHAAPAGHGEGHRAADRGRALRRRRPARPGDQRALRDVVPRPPARALRRHAPRARRVPRGAGQRRPLARRGPRDRVPGDPRVRRRGRARAARVRRRVPRRAQP